MYGGRVKPRLTTCKENVLSLYCLFGPHSMLSWTVTWIDVLIILEEIFKVIKYGNIYGRGKRIGMNRVWEQNTSGNWNGH